MAEVLTELPGGLGRPSKYPWLDWTDGRAWRIVEGEDFHCSKQSMRRTLYGRAYGTGMKVSVRMEPDAIAFQFVEAS